MSNNKLNDIQHIKKNIIKMSNEIYEVLGSGHTESVYHKALLVELRNAGFDYDSEVITPIYYKGHCVGSGRADIVIRYKGIKTLNKECSLSGFPTTGIEVTKQLVIELKALVDIKRQDFKKTQSYMRSLGSNEGMMINFPQCLGSIKCETADIIITKCIDIESGKVFY